MKIAGQTDIGKHREENQDSYCAGRQQNDTVWAVVCDGMGGAYGGAIASHTATDTIEDLFVAGLDNIQNEQDAKEFLFAAIAAANRKVHQKASEQAAARGMGTTLAALLAHQGTAHIAHVGDSRVYRLREGELLQLTRDHSIVQELVEDGSITELEARNHPRKNLITRALGVEREVEAEYSAMRVQNKDLFLLCSDGLSGCVSADEIKRILQATPFFKAASILIKAALAAGGQDNITAVLVQIESVEE